MPHCSFPIFDDLLLIFASSNIYFLASNDQKHSWSSSNGHKCFPTCLSYHAMAILESWCNPKTKSVLQWFFALPIDVLHQNFSINSWFSSHSIHNSLERFLDPHLLIILIFIFFVILEKFHKIEGYVVVNWDLLKVC